jgi:predicted amidohydrolase
MRAASSSSPSIAPATRTARRHIGKSMIVNPVGASVMAVAGVDEPQLLVQEIDLDEVASAQRSLPWWRDRRPDLYKHLV